MKSAPVTNENNLLHLLTEARGDGRAVEHFVCMDCLELAEKPAETAGAIHECPSPSLLWRLPQREYAGTK